MNQCQALVPL